MCIKCGSSRQKWKMTQDKFLQSFFARVLTGTEIPIRPITDSKTSEFKLDVNMCESITIMMLQRLKLL